MLIVREGTLELIRRPDNANDLTLTLRYLPTCFRQAKHVQNTLLVENSLITSIRLNA